MATSRNNNAKRGSNPIGPVSFEGGFQGSAQSLRFNPESAIDTSEQERERLRQRIRDDDTRSKALSAQQKLDTGVLRNTQAYDTASLKFEQAEATGRLKLI